jgi:DNA-binding GntR family transcriptional regulator
MASHIIERSSTQPADPTRSATASGAHAAAPESGPSAPATAAKARRLSAAVELPQTQRRKGLRTLPEQIADDLGAAIARGEYNEGDRLLELSIAAHYGVSRGPVREALRILSQRGLAVLYPRKGALVAGISLDSLVDLFNVRSVLMGLAARYFALMAAEDARLKLKQRLEDVCTAAQNPNIPPTEFVRMTRRVSMQVSSRCGCESLSRLIDHQNESSAWVSLWQSGRLDFHTQERRQKAALDYQALGRAIERRCGAKAEATMRAMIMISREQAMAVLAQGRREQFDERRLLRE